MPVSRCTNGKFRVGSGKCVFTSKKKAESAQRAIKARENRRR